MTTLLMSGILVFGIVAYQGLPVSDLPTVMPVAPVAPVAPHA